MVMPAIARRHPEGGYKLIAGYRREVTCKIAGFENIHVLMRGNEGLP
ncbi:MAG: ParB N-terminal domain-containing protein [Burkholderiales bacterium]